LNTDAVFVGFVPARYFLIIVHAIVVRVGAGAGNGISRRAGATEVLRPPPVGNAVAHAVLITIHGRVAKNIRGGDIEVSCGVRVVGALLPRHRHAEVVGAGAADFDEQIAPGVGDIPEIDRCVRRVGAVVIVTLFGPVGAAAGADDELVKVVGRIAVAVVNARDVEKVVVAAKINFRAGGGEAFQNVLRAVGSEPRQSVWNALNAGSWP